MTEPRSKITLKWRPAGVPAPRYDDFLEEASVAEVRMLAPARPVERRSINRRLEDWGAWANARDARGSACMTGAICDRARRAAVGDRPSHAGVHERISSADATRINNAFARLSVDHRQLLRWTYVKGMKDAVVAKKCGFPRAEYASRLAAAQTAIESAINENARRVDERQRF